MYHNTNNTIMHHTYTHKKYHSFLPHHHHNSGWCEASGWGWRGARAKGGKDVVLSVLREGMQCCQNSGDATLMITHTPCLSTCPTFYLFFFLFPSCCCSLSYFYLLLFFISFMVSKSASIFLILLPHFFLPCLTFPHFFHISSHPFPRILDLPHFVSLCVTVSHSPLPCLTRTLSHSLSARPTQPHTIPRSLSPCLTSASPFSPPLCTPGEAFPFPLKILNLYSQEWKDLC